MKAPAEARRLEYMPLGALEGAKRNPKRHLDAEIGQSIGRFGFTEPLVLDERTSRLVAGHGRLMSLRTRLQAGEAPPAGVKLKGAEWLVPVLRGWASRSDTEAEAYLLASNQLTIGGGWSDVELAEMLKGLSDAQALEGVGFGEDELAALLGTLGGTEGLTDADEGETSDGMDDVPEAPDEKDVWVRPGDVFELGQHTLTCGDSREVLAGLGRDSLHAVVTDPPYELGFMGKTWDSSGIAYSVDLWTQVLRVLKPGGHLLAFGGTRTYHRMTCAIEDAGFEVRDCLFWHYGTGFPKSLNLPGGFGTALKPATEPIVLARKPLVGTVAANVAAHGTGALNIDGCRIASADGYTENAVTQGINTARTSFDPRRERRTFEPSQAGRWPANVLLDEDAARELDAQSGKTRSPSGPVKQGGRKSSGGILNATGEERNGEGVGYGDSGGASRFFYVAKPSRRERDERGEADSEDAVDNNHPTVKPVELMRYLVRLVTPSGATVLEPFSGSGTTLLACEVEGFACRAVEKETAYVQVALERWERFTGKKARKVT